MNQDDANLEIFRTLAASGELDFTQWLRTYLAGGEAYPFLMGGPRQYDLGDLFRALLPSAKVHEQRILETAFQRSLAASASGFDLEPLQQLAHAAARSGFNTVTHDLANGVETILLKLERAQWSEAERASAFIATDQIIAAVASFAFEGNRNALRVCKVLFNQDDLAPFASNLFTPLALEKLMSWPDLWRRLVEQATRPAKLFDKEPELGMAFSFGDVFATKAAHFDALRVFEDLLASIAVKGYRLQDVYEAVHAGNLEARTMKFAKAALEEMERRRAILRRPCGNHDQVFLSPRLGILEQTTRHRTDDWTAIVDPEPVRDWRSAHGQLPQQMEHLLEKELA